MARPDRWTTPGGRDRPGDLWNTNIRADSVLFSSGRWSTPQDVVDIRAAILLRVGWLTGRHVFSPAEREVLCSELSSAVEYAKVLFRAHVMIMADAQYEYPLLCEVASQASSNTPEVKVDIRRLVLDPLDEVLGPTHTRYRTHWTDIFGLAAPAPAPPTSSTAAATAFSTLESCFEGRCWGSACLRTSPQSWD